MKKSYIKILLVLFIFPIILNLAGCSNNKKNILNESFIKESILKKELINADEKSSFSLIDSVDVSNNSTIVGYKTNSSQGVVVFDKDKDNNYNIVDGNSVGVDDGLGVTTHSINYDNTMALVILGNSKSVSKVEVLVNNSKKQTYELTPEKPSMFILDKNLIKDANGNASIEFVYLDKNGNKINK